MSWNNYAAHLYGVGIEGSDMRDDVLEKFGGGDAFDLFDAIMTNNYPKEFPEEAKSVEVFGGPGNIWYVGYGAQMPYEPAYMSKEDMDKSIRAFVEFLVGKENATGYEPGSIYEAWSE